MPCLINTLPSYPIHGVLAWERFLSSLTITHRAQWPNLVRQAPLTQLDRYALAVRHGGLYWSRVRVSGSSEDLKRVTQRQYLKMPVHGIPSSESLGQLCGISSG
jgi:hypothetical protein